MKMERTMVEKQQKMEKTEKDKKEAAFQREFQEMMLTKQHAQEEKARRDEQAFQLQMMDMQKQMMSSHKTALHQKPHNAQPQQPRQQNKDYSLDGGIIRDTFNLLHLILMNVLRPLLCALTLG